LVLVMMIKTYNIGFSGIDLNAYSLNTVILNTMLVNIYNEKSGDS